MADTLAEIAKRNFAKKGETYLQVYSEKFDHLRNEPIKILELGVQGGGSVKMWSEYFPHSQVVGIDIDDCTERAKGERIQFFQGRQEDRNFLKGVLRKTGIEEFDIIIDDASHFGLYTKKSYEILFDDHLKSGGFYVIEDWGTGYWDDWPDGCRFQEVALETEIPEQTETKFIYRPDEASGLLPKLFHSHQFGMVGFIKQLVDEAHRGAIRNIHPRRFSKFRSMTLMEGIAIIAKK